MRARAEISTALKRLAVAQSDVVTRTQAEGLGLSRHTLARLVGQGQWQRLDRGLFLTHSGAHAWESLAWAGVLIGGEGARLGGEASAHLCRLVPEAPASIEVLVPHGSGAKDRRPWAFSQERPGARNPRTTGSPPRLLVPDTVLDLCARSSARDVEEWVTRAVQKGLTTPLQLSRTLAMRGRHPHRALLTELLLDVDEGAESPLELRYLRDVERPHGLPKGTRQRVDPARAAVRDVLYEKWRVLVELDGRLGHEGAGRFRDMRRDNLAMVGQLGTLRYGFGDVAGWACEVAWQVADVLVKQGWNEEFVRCPRCPPFFW